MAESRQFPLDELKEGVQKIQALLDKVEPTLEQDSNLHRSVKAAQETGEKIMKKSKPDT